jgi:hypothetical protein
MMIDYCFEQTMTVSSCTVERYDIITSELSYDNAMATPDTIAANRQPYWHNFFKPIP